MASENDPENIPKGVKVSRLRSMGSGLQPVVMVGKDGLSPGVVRDTDAQLDSKKLIKVKLQQKADRTQVRELARELASRTSSLLIEIKGRTFLLWRERRRA